MSFIADLWDKIKEFAFMILRALGNLAGVEGAGNVYTAIARWVFIFLALFIVVKAITALLRTRTPPEVFGYFSTGERVHPITHWENAVGRAKSCDIVISDKTVSRNHGILDRDDNAVWVYTALDSRI